MALNRVHGWRSANVVELCLDSMTVISINVQNLRYFSSLLSHSGSNRRSCCR